MLWLIVCVDMLVCRKHKPSSIHKTTQVRRSLFNNVGNVAGEAAGPPRSWGLLGASGSVAVLLCLGQVSCSHVVWECTALRTEPVALRRLHRDSSSNSDFSRPNALTGPFETFSLYSWEQKLTISYFWPNQLWPGNQRGSCDTESKAFQTHPLIRKLV